MNFLQILNEFCKNYPELAGAIAIGFLVTLGRFFWNSSSESQTVIHNHIHISEPQKGEDVESPAAPVVNVNVTQNNKNVNKVKKETPKCPPKRNNSVASVIENEYDEHGNKTKKVEPYEDWFGLGRRALAAAVAKEFEEMDRADEAKSEKSFETLSPGVHTIQGYAFKSNESYVRITANRVPPNKTWPEHSCFHFSKDTLNPCGIDLGNISEKDKPVKIEARVLVEEGFCEWKKRNRPNESSCQPEFFLLTIRKV